MGNFFVLGATGGTGRAFVTQARAQGHSVTAFVRSPDKLGHIDGVNVVKGDPRNTAELAAALPGHDVVVSALGPIGTAKTTIVSECAQSTISAMQQVGVQRLLVVSVAVLFDGGFIFKLMRNTFLRHVADDSEVMERLVMASGLQWMIVRPPRLTNGATTGKYRLENDRSPKRGYVVSRNDVAHFMLTEALHPKHTGHIVGMAY